MSFVLSVHINYDMFTSKGKNEGTLPSEVQEKQARYEKGLCNQTSQRIAALLAMNPVGEFSIETPGVLSTSHCYRSMKKDLAGKGWKVKEEPDLLQALYNSIKFNFPTQTMTFLPKSSDEP